MTQSGHRECSANVCYLYLSCGFGHLKDLKDVRGLTIEVNQASDSGMGNCDGQIWLADGRPSNASGSHMTAIFVPATPYLDSIARPSCSDAERKHCWLEQSVSGSVVTSILFSAPTARPSTQRSVNFCRLFGSGET
jgi:hypothetical protein